MGHQIFTLIEEITRKDHSKYLEIANMVMNGRAELAAERGFIEEVRILQLNIPHSAHVINYENYINERYAIPDEDMDHWEEWEKDDKIMVDFNAVLKENHIS
ncbi:hypothetical protein [Pediococcus cellicola]|uniref:Uncharacterized protein n=1 Tax=Pediococcus cellicola TaxID=319652 RepID=A0A0R2IT33_9LACO|nr:hypothetical protein [Pediococcus cellicola]KRN66662.1 hypothetical protein IV80_GL001253 [Pediococcus cellicola]GEL14694.1 hypothetical protein PCE01_04960 [Pediococcus cellicola]